MKTTQDKNDVRAMKTTLILHGAVSAAAFEAIGPGIHTAPGVAVLTQRWCHLRHSCQPLYMGVAVGPEDDNGNMARRPRGAPNGRLLQSARAPTVLHELRP